MTATKVRRAVEPGHALLVTARRFVTALGVRLAAASTARRVQRAKDPVAPERLQAVRTSVRAQAELAGESGRAEQQRKRLRGSG
jgi:hypothetical protein